ncbi:hypothetical protein K2173_020642 [Erythroxylum novogranatense]|uniref:DDE Tnp4 domain-containing protein n=1 Tax=Erythroxylum novogranatense TaxID=1862640 RepID=A0AAV8TLI7_9ROSI|nr:hypothetical protein K2173_020642 [Erythroxylum novogranatense]
MAIIGGSSDNASPAASKTPKPATKSTGKRKPRKGKTQNAQLLPLLESAASVTGKFMSLNDLHLLPSQFLSIESLLSSLPFSAPQSPLTQSFFHRFLSSSDELDTRWYDFFRMSKPTFCQLVSLLSPSLLTSLPPSMSPDSAVAATLFRLAHGASYKVVTRAFGLGTSETACVAFYSVCKAVNEKFGNLFELRRDWERIVNGFVWISLPNCCGVLGFGKFGIDSKLLGIDGSLIVQALIDAQGRFLDISAGWPSSMEAESILRQTKLYMDVEESREGINGSCYELCDGNQIPQYIIGDSCLPLLPWLLTPYRTSSIREESFNSGKREFNAAHKRAMGLVDTAFGRVKARWKLLGRRWKEECVECFPFVIVMACLLHNFLIKCSEPLPEDCVGWFKEEQLAVFNGETDDESGCRIRDSIAEHLSLVVVIMGWRSNRPGR